MIRRRRFGFQIRRRRRRRRRIKFWLRFRRVIRVGFRPDRQAQRPDLSGRDPREAGETAALRRFFVAGPGLSVHGQPVDVLLAERVAGQGDFDRLRSRRPDEARLLDTSDEDLAIVDLVIHGMAASGQG